MKIFRKNTNGMFVCEECEKSCRNFAVLSKHIFNHHKSISKKDYFDKWIKEPGDDNCKICGEPAIFQSIKGGYKNFCCRKCKGLYSYQKSSEYIYAKYGVTNQFARKDIIAQIKHNYLDKFGVENPNQIKEVREKIKNTCQDRYGCDFALQDKNIRRKGITTMISRYGVEHQSQNENIHHNQMLSGKKIKKFRDTMIWYQGTYELDFLERYYERYPTISRGPSIKYAILGKNKIYHPDFFIKDLNLIIECKNSYMYKRDKDIIFEKEKATISNGFNYCIIIDKDYTNFNKLG